MFEFLTRAWGAANESFLLPFVSFPYLEMLFRERSAELLLMSIYTEMNTQYRLHLHFEYYRRRTRKTMIKSSRLAFRKYLAVSQISCVTFTKSFNLSLIQLHDHKSTSQ